MKLKLKRFRVDAGLTQAKIAAAVGVTQPNYQRWESGSAPIPKDKITKLAEVLNTTSEAIFSRHPPIEAAFYDPSASDALSYYGEVSVHFCSGAQSLLLSISEDAFSKLHLDLQKDIPFVVVRSLANQTVCLRTKAIADLYFSSEAYDDYGPEHGQYQDHVSIQLPDSRDWEIIHSLATDDADTKEYSPVDIERVRKQIMIEDHQYAKLIADGHIKPEELEVEREKNQKATDKIFRSTYTTVYQLASGHRRSIEVFDSEKLFDAFGDLVEGDVDIESLIRLETEGRHRIVFINKGILDYVLMPTHQLEQGRFERNAEIIDSV